MRLSRIGVALADELLVNGWSIRVRDSSLVSQSEALIVSQPGRHLAAQPTGPPLRWWQSLWVDRVLLVAILAGLMALTVTGARRMQYNWQWYRVPDFLWRNVDGEWIAGPLIRGLVVTLEIAGLAMLVTLVVGLGTALLRMSQSFAGRGLATLYLEVVRNTPILVQIFIFYFVVGPILGIGRFWVGVLTLSFFEATFAAEVIRGAIEAVPKGQREASQALGLTPAKVMRLVVLPQALPLMIPPLTGVLVNLVKHSAIVSTIAIADLTTMGRNLISDTFMSFEIWLTVAAMYLVITVSLSSLAQWFERTLALARLVRERTSFVSVISEEEQNR
jgi:polar amino acid transport system permease protein